MAQHSARGTAWEAQRLRVLNRDAWTCVYCGKDLVGKDAQVDHIVPISSNPGATYGDHELVACCARCNQKKGARLITRRGYMNPVYFKAVNGSLRASEGPRAPGVPGEA